MTYISQDGTSEEGREEAWNVRVANLVLRLSTFDNAIPTY